MLHPVSLQSPHLSISSIALTFYQSKGNLRQAAAELNASRLLLPFCLNGSGTVDKQKSSFNYVFFGLATYLLTFPHYRPIPHIGFHIFKAVCISNPTQLALDIHQMSPGVLSQGRSLTINLKSLIRWFAFPFTENPALRTHHPLLECAVHHNEAGAPVQFVMKRSKGLVVDERLMNLVDECMMNLAVSEPVMDHLVDGRSMGHLIYERLLDPVDERSMEHMVDERLLLDPVD